MARTIDKRIMLDLIIEAKKTDPETGPFSEWLAEYLVDHLPTLTQPNEWVKVMEAINNAAVAYIEGGPYENDLPGMEFALKIDRLSRDFVHPPEGEEDTKDDHVG